MAFMLLILALKNTDIKKHEALAVEICMAYAFIFDVLFLLGLFLR